MEEDYLLKLTFWGVRGSTPTPRIQNLTFGGNTSCLEVRTGEGEVLIFDAGTGITPLGWHLVEKEEGPLDVKIFMTHFHWDHIQGIPFFQPLYSPENKVTFFSFENRAEGMLKGQMTAPYFPVSFDFLPAQMEFHPIQHSPFKIGGAEISPFPMNHPQGATGYRIERGAKGLSTRVTTSTETASLMLLSETMRPAPGFLSMTLNTPLMNTSSGSAGGIAPGWKRPGSPPRLQSIS